jgi:hypothetical protein
VETTRQWSVPKIESHSEAGGWVKAAMGRNAVWQTALAAACVAIVALGVQLYNVPAGDQYKIASNINGAGGATLIVTFHPGATAGDIGTLLTSLNAKIVDGPKPGGAYTVELPSNQASDVEAATTSLLARKDLVAGVMAGQ